MQRFEKVPFIVVLLVFGLGLSGAFLAAVSIMFDPDSSMLFSRELYTRLCLCLTTGVGTIVCAVVVGVTPLDGRKLAGTWLGFLIMIICITFGIAVSKIGLEYAGGLSGPKILDEGLVNRGFGHNATVTNAWNEIERRYRCSARKLLLSPHHQNPVYSDPEWSVLKPAMSFMKNDSKTCEQAFVSYHYNMKGFDVVVACSRQCVDVVQAYAKSWVVALSVLCVFTVVLELAALCFLAAKLLIALCINRKSDKLDKSDGLMTSI